MNGLISFCAKCGRSYLRTDGECCTFCRPPHKEHQSLWRQGPPAARAIIGEECWRMDVSPSAVMQTAIRQQRVVAARRRIIGRMRRELGWSLTKIGKCLGMDHSSVHYNLVREAADALDGQPDY